MDLDLRKIKLRHLIIIGTLILLILLPFVSGRYTIRVFTSVLLFAGLAYAWNIIGGYTGYVAFGNTAFFGIGAYTTGLMMLDLHTHFLLGVLAGGVLSFLFAVFIGLPLLRLKTHYFALSTLGVAEAVRGVCENLKMTRGGAGITLPLMKMSMEKVYLYFYFAMLIFMVLSVLTTYYITKIRLGRGLVAIRENEEAANVMGVNATLYKVISFGINGLFTGLFGGIYAYWLTFIEPVDVFNVMVSVKVVVMVLLGGAGTLFGPFLGAIGLELLSELVWSKFLIFHTGVLGIAIIIVILIMPKGLADLVKNWKTFSFIGTIKKYRI